MLLDIHYGHVAKSKDLRQYVEENLNKINKVSDLEDSQVDVWLENESSVFSRGLPEFQTRIMIHKPGQREMTASAKSNRLSDSVRMAATRLKKRLRKSK